MKVYAIDVDEADEVIIVNVAPLHTHTFLSLSGCVFACDYVYELPYISDCCNME